MAPRANWKGFLRLSLVTCPVALYPATSESEKISFNQLNRKTGHRIKYAKVDADTGEEVDNEDIVKGYMLDKETFVEVTKEELEEVALESTRTIEIDEFVEKSEIDPRYLIRPYYLRPDGKVGHDAFAVIRETIREMDKVAIGRVVLTIQPLPKSHNHCDGVLVDHVPGDRRGGVFEGVAQQHRPQIRSRKGPAGMTRDTAGIADQHHDLGAGRALSQRGDVGEGRIVEGSVHMKTEDVERAGEVRPDDLDDLLQPPGTERRRIQCADVVGSSDGYQLAGLRDSQKQVCDEPAPRASGRARSGRWRAGVRVASARRRAGPAGCACGLRSERRRRCTTRPGARWRSGARGGGLRR